MKRVIIDCQALQHQRADAILHALDRVLNELRDHHVTIVLNGADLDGVAFVRANVDHARVAEIRTWSNVDEPGVEWRTAASNVLREALIASLQPNVVIQLLPAGSEAGWLAQSLRMIGKLSPIIAFETDRATGDEHFQTLKQHNPDQRLLRGRLTRDKVVVSVGRRNVALRDFVADELKIEPVAKPRLAFVAPLPPARSGIADYAREVAEGLAAHYDVTVVVADDLVDQVQSSELTFIGASNFRDANKDFDRVVYNFGNSPFHHYMVDLMTHVPGIVILHDFFLGDLFYYADQHSGASFVDRLQVTHGYGPILELMRDARPERLLGRYPLNSSVVDNARSVIVHSDFARKLAAHWCGDAASSSFHVVPLPRTIPDVSAKTGAREDLGVDVTDFLVCSFGLVTANKKIDLLLKAWNLSHAGRRAGSKLVLVGDVAEGPFAETVRSAVSNSNGSVELTGWADAPTYERYLGACDLAVQLRSATRGETSAAALDTMKFGIPTIVNQNGSMADLPEDAVAALPDEFTVNELAELIDRLRDDPSSRRALGDKALAYVRENHELAVSAREIFQVIEEAYSVPDFNSDVAINRLLDVLPNSGFAGEYANLLAETIRPRTRAPMTFVDVSAIIRSDLKTGIQRVVRSVVSELMRSAKGGMAVYPIYLSDDNHWWKYRHALRWTYREFGIDYENQNDDIVEFFDRDKLIIADFTGPMLYQIESDARLYSRIRSCGVEVSSIVYDILPIKHPKLFPEFAAAHGEWLKAVGAVSDRVICISRSVADDLSDWYEETGNVSPRVITHFHLGADIENSTPTRGVAPERKNLLAELKDRKFVLAVGTLEPRKCHAQVLDAMESLWAKGSQLELVFVGKLGWMVKDLEKRLDKHPERDRKLHWMYGISDEELDLVYKAASVLIAPSIDEGFGLPLIEAAQYKLPIIARDIPVFREVAGDHAFYFTGMSGEELAAAIEEWERLFDVGQHPKSDDMPWLTWAQSAEQLLDAVLDREAVDHGAPRKPGD